MPKAPKNPLLASPPPLRPLLSKLLCEFFGTLVIVFVYGVAASPGLTAEFAVTIGTTVVAMIYAGGHITGGLYNPAVTVAVFVRGKIDFGLCCAYLAMQLLAGFLGALSSMCLKYGKGTGFIGRPTLGEGVTDGSACLAEIVVTFAMCHTFLHVATTVTQANNSYYGLATGFTVLSGTISVGGVSGACFNPAVAMLTLVHKWQMWSDSDFATFDSIETGADKVWIHVVGPLVGGIFAGVLFLATHPRELDSGARCAKQREAAAPMLVEFVGTFLIAFTYACAAAAHTPLGQQRVQHNNQVVVVVVGQQLVALSLGCMVAAQIYAGGVTSGGHYNPAITLAVLVRRKLVEFYSSSATLKQRFVTPLAVMFMFTQCTAALCGGGIARGVLRDDWPNNGDTIGFPVPQHVEFEGVVTVQRGRAVFGELVATAVLVYLALHSFTSEKCTGNSFFGLAVGMAVCGLTGTLRSITGGALSPALGLLGLCVKVTDDDFSPQHNIWIYWVGPPVGAVMAAVLFHIISFDEVNPPHRIMTKNTALATLDPTEQHFHAYFAPGSGLPMSGIAAPAEKVRLHSVTQGDFVCESRRGSTQSVSLPPPDPPPPPATSGSEYATTSSA